MRVCLLIGAGGSGGHEGVVDYTSRLAESLAPDVECEVLSLPGKGASGAIQLARASRRFDVVHVQLPCYGWRYSLLPTLLPYLVPRQVKLAATFHEWEFMHALRRRLLGRMILGLDGAVFVSPLVREQFLADHPGWGTGGKLETIPIGVNVGAVDPGEPATMAERKTLLRDEENARLLVHFGTIYEGKQPERLLRAVAALAEDGSQIRLALVGSFIETAEFREAAFRAQVRALGLEDRVAFLGSIDDEARLARVMASADAVVGLYSDGLSMRRSTFWYAAQFGVPIISTAPASSFEFADRPDVLAYPGLRLVPIEGGAEEVAEDVRGLPAYRYRPFAPLAAQSWQDIAERHAQLYRALGPGRG